MLVSGVKIFKNFTSPAYSYGLQCGCWVPSYLYNILWNQYKSSRTSFSGSKHISHSSKFEVFWLFCLYSFQLKIPSAITFLYSLCLWFNPTGHQGQDECKSREWQVIGRERKRNWRHIISLFIIQPPGYGTLTEMLPAEGWRGQRKSPDRKLLVGIPHVPHKPSWQQNARGNVPSEQGTWDLMSVGPQIGSRFRTFLAHISPTFPTIFSSM